MKTKLHVLLAVATALGTCLGIAQEDRKPNPPPDQEAPPRPPGAERAAPQPDRPPRPDGERPQERQRRPEGERPPEHMRRPDGDRSPEGGRRPEGPRPSEGDRRPDAGRHSGNEWHMPVPPPPAPPKPTSFLGVVTAPLPPPLSAQLGLPEGFGLVVGDVLPDRPAAKAGIQRYDVLTKFNDQQLVDAGQFSTLVRAQAKDADATLTLFRKAQEQKVNVKIGQRMMSERRPFPSPSDFHRHLEGMKGPIRDGVKQLQDRAKDFGDRMKDFQKRMQDWQKNPSAEMPRPPEPPSVNPANILREVQPGGVAQIRLLQPNGTVSYHTANAKLLVKDENGEIEISTNDGKRILLARNAQGETIFDGPIDTEEQRKALPDDIRKRVELIEVQTNVAQFEQALPPPASPDAEVQ